MKPTDLLEKNAKDTAKEAPENAGELLPEDKLDKISGGFEPEEPVAPLESEAIM